MICRVEIEGCDRCGKDTLVGYIDYLSNRQMPVGSRGLLSTIVYNDIYNRFMSAKRKKEMIEGNKETLIVLLYGEPQDIELRCKITHEHGIDVIRDMNAFSKHAVILQEKGIKVLSYNTSEMTPYQIALDVMHYIEEANK